MDDPLLHARHVLGRHFDAEIAARHHQPVGKFDDLAEPIDRRRLFELDHDPGPAGDELASLGDVVGPLHEREGDPIRALFEREGEIGAVLFGHRRQRQDRIRHVDALAVGKRAADATQRLGKTLAAGLGLEPHLAVVEQQLGPGAQRFEYLRMREGRAVLVPGPSVEVESETLPGAQFDRTRSKGAEPQLRPLQIGQDADRPPGRAFDVPDGFEPRAMFGMSSVTEIEAEDVDSGLEQGADLLQGRARRAESGDNLGAASAPHGQASPLAAPNTRIARKSLTLVSVGPVTTRSPSAEKNPWPSLSASASRASTPRAAARAILSE